MYELNLKCNIESYIWTVGSAILRFRTKQPTQDIIMKKIALTLAALAALSSAALASQRGYDLRDSDTYFGKYATASQSNVDVNAFAAAEGKAGLTAFERLQLQSQENENSGH